MGTQQLQGAGGHHPAQDCSTSQRCMALQRSPPHLAGADGLQCAVLVKPLSAVLCGFHQVAGAGRTDPHPTSTSFPAAGGDICLVQIPCIWGLSLWGALGRLRRGVLRFAGSMESLDFAGRVGTSPLVQGFISMRGQGAGPSLAWCLSLFPRAIPLTLLIAATPSRLLERA